MTFIIPDSEHMQAFGEKLGALLLAGDVLVLNGPLGAGKTTLTGGIARGMGVSERITSPTFVVSRVHKGNDIKLVHVDAYRLTSAADVDELDLDLHGPHALVMEWGRPFVADYTDSWLDVDIVRDEIVHEDDPSGGERVITVTGHGPRWADVDIQGALA